MQVLTAFNLQDWIDRHREFLRPPVCNRQVFKESADGFVRFCDHCNAQLYAEYEHSGDIEQQLPPIFERFYRSTDARTCKHCGHVAPGPSTH